MSSKTLTALLIGALLYLLSTSGGSPGTGPGHAPSSEAALTTGRIQVAAALRSAPEATAERLAVLDAGTLVVLEGEQGEWLRVRVASGLVGWVWRPLVQTTSTPGGLPTSPPGTFPSPQPAGDGFAVVAYYVQDSYNPSYTSLARYGQHLTAIAPWSWSVDASGAIAVAMDVSELDRALRLAGSQGLETYMLVHNYQGDTFDAGAVHRLLNDPQAVRRAVDGLADQVARYQSHGVVLDFENVPPGDRAALTRFVEALAQRLHQDGKRLTIALPAKTSDSPQSPHAGAFDYAALGRVADGLWLMTYDEHYRTGRPGPIASATWVEQVIRYITRVVDNPRKILVGLPAYGYDWGAGGPARALTFEQAMRTLTQRKATLRWHPTYKVPYFVAADREVWFENRYSAAYKVQLARSYGLGGVAIWRLGQEDPGLWSELARGS